MTTQWQLPIAPAHRLGAVAGVLTFVGGAADLDADGIINNPANLHAQIPGAVANLVSTLASESCGADDVVRLKVYYRAERGLAPWPIMSAILDHFPADPAPAVTMQPVVMQPFDGQEVQIQAIAQRGWRSNQDIRVVRRSVPAQHRERFPDGKCTAGLRAGELIVVPGKTASDDPGSDMDGIEQTQAIMQTHGETLTSLGASFSDVVKTEGYYDGKNIEQWAEMAAVRARHYPEPGPVATVVPWHARHPEDASTQIEVLAMRQQWNGFDKYIPRGDSWPQRVWDWPIPLPYRQGLRLRDTIWLGGQVPWASGANTGDPVMAGQMLAQTQFVMTYVNDILHGFGAGTGDLALLVCYFTSDGTAESTTRFIETLAGSVHGPLPPLTLVPQPYMHNPETQVEIWGVARG